MAAPDVKNPRWGQPLNRKTETLGERANRQDRNRRKSAKKRPAVVPKKLPRRRTCRNRNRRRISLHLRRS